MSTRPSDRFWDTDRHRDRRPFLTARAAALAAIRGWFGEEGFTEVEPSALQVSPGNETHIHALHTEVSHADGRRRTRYLHTSPELAMKKLLAAGETRIFALAQVYRDGDRSPLHATAFTMLEWYRVEASLEDAMDDTVAVARCVAAAIGAGRLAWKEAAADPSAAPERISVNEALARHAGIDLADVADDRNAFAAAARRAGVRVADDDTWSDVFSRVLVERVEPHLGVGQLSLLVDYPPSEAALARIAPGPNPVARRFELYAAGVELANGFDELTDPAEQRRRFEAAMARREELYGDRYPIDEDFLDALAAMPQACGVALGFDRLVALATGAPSVHHVIWTPDGGIFAAGEPA